MMSACLHICMHPVCESILRFCDEISKLNQNFVREFFTQKCLIFSQVLKFYFCKLTYKQGGGKIEGEIVEQ